MRILTPLCLCLTLSITGCSWMGFGDDEEEKKSETENYTERQFYEAIEKSMRANNWQRAIETLQALEAKYPFGGYAEQAQLNLIYAYYRSRDYQAAIAAADRFIRLQPQHPDVDYAHYLKGLAAFSESRSFVGSFLPTDITKRDPGAARESFVAFNQLLSRYPNSPYAADARKRMIHLRNHLARYEIHVANYYFKRGAYLAAVNRGKYVVENFQKTPAVADGLAIMAQGYYLLGIQDLADDAVTVLIANYPDYPALDKDGNFNFREDVSGEKRPWVNKLSFGLIGNPEAPGYDTREIYNPAYKPKHGKGRNVEEERSWLSIITFGLFD